MYDSLSYFSSDLLPGILVEHSLHQPEALSEHPANERCTCNVSKKQAYILFRP